MADIVRMQLTFVSNVGDKSLFTVAYVIAAVIYLYFAGYKRDSLMMIIAGASTVFAALLKLIFRQPRPITASPHRALFDSIYGFPSSHTLVYTAIWGLTLYLCFKLTGIPLAIRVLAGLASFYFISLVGISRVYLGQHYIWDVIGGYIFGFLYLLVLIKLEGQL